MTKRFLESLSGKVTDRPPFWFMRQAGRYLPEYREVRAKHKNFLQFCYTPDAATEVTLQPITRFGMDAAIIFSDILVVPDALGAEVSFEEGEGPRITPITDAAALGSLSLEALEEKLAPVYQALRQTRAALPAETALIGFAGAPWTLACYMVDGRGTRKFDVTRRLAEADGLLFSRLINLLTRAVIRHLDLQIRAGAEVVQLFDSWAGIASGDLYTNYVVEPAFRIVTEIKKMHPTVPIIGFPRQCGVKCLDYVRQSGVTAVSVDDSVTLSWVRSKLQPVCVVQGMLDQNLLAENKTAMLNQAAEIIRELKDRPFIFNLAHGVLPKTPVEHVQALCDLIKAS
ncbi:MAG: uroporphyrinogen decarboxylase [Alphaproteobacteria bacterium]|nr:uroporphyrinogen decarboxylase [Alphaproteobacteria bacterium]